MPITSHRKNKMEMEGSEPLCLAVGPGACPAQNTPPRRCICHFLIKAAETRCQGSPQISLFFYFAATERKSHCVLEAGLSWRLAMRLLPPSLIAPLIAGSVCQNKVTAVQRAVFTQDSSRAAVVQGAQPKRNPLSKGQERKESRRDRCRLNRVGRPSPGGEANHGSGHFCRSWGAPYPFPPSRRVGFPGRGDFV